MCRSGAIRNDIVVNIHLKIYMYILKNSKSLFRPDSIYIFLMSSLMLNNALASCQRYFLTSVVFLSSYVNIKGSRSGLKSALKYPTTRNFTQLTK